CATSAVMTMVSPSSSASNWMAKSISGSASGGDSASAAGPAMATTRPSFSSLVSGVSAVMVMGRCSCSSVRSVVGNARGEQVVVAAFDGVAEEIVGADVAAARAQRLRATHDLHDLGGDGVLAGAVHAAAQAGDEVFRIIGGRL